MATLANGAVPGIKIDPAAEYSVKDEPMEDDNMPYMDDADGDLDFSGAKQNLWLGRVPRGLWNVLSKLGTMGDDDEIEIGTIREETLPNNALKYSLLLNQNLPQFRNQHIEYNLFDVPQPERRAKKHGQAFVFSEQDLPGYKPRKFNFDEVDDDGNPAQAGSRLFESYKRKQNEKKRKAEQALDGTQDTGPRQRKIPKKTAMQGTVQKEFRIEPVKNEYYLKVESAQAASLLDRKEKTEAVLIDQKEVIRMEAGGIAETAAANKAADKQRTATQKQARQDQTIARMEIVDLQQILFNAFSEFKKWKFGQLKARTRQPTDYLRQVLSEIAFRHQGGDTSGAWQLKPQYEAQLVASKYEGEVATGVEEDYAGDEGDDDDVVFQDVTPKQEVA